MTQQTYSTAYHLARQIKDRIRDLAFMGNDPVADQEYHININNAECMVSKDTLNKLRAIVKADLESELSELEKQFDAL